MVTWSALQDFQRRKPEGLDGSTEETLSWYLVIHIINCNQSFKHSPRLNAVETGGMKGENIGNSSIDIPAKSKKSIQRTQLSWARRYYPRRGQDLNLRGRTQQMAQNRPKRQVLVCRLNHSATSPIVDVGPHFQAYNTWNHVAPCKQTRQS